MVRRFNQEHVSSLSSEENSERFVVKLFQPSSRLCDQQKGGPLILLERIRGVVSQRLMGRQWLGIPENELLSSLKPRIDLDRRAIEDPF